MRHGTARTRAVVLASALMLTASACGFGGGDGAGGGGGSGSNAQGDKAAGSSGATPSGDPKSGGSATFSYAVDPTSVDSANCGSSVSWMPCTAIYGTLVTYDPATLTYSPGMAEKFDSPDGKVWTITLRPDLKFSDGTSYDAEAVAFNWERAKNPASRNPSASDAAAMRWQVKDPRTIEVTLPATDYTFPSLLYTALGVIGSPTAIKAKGADFAAAPVGAGPFTFVSWARGTEMKLKRNPTYYDAPRPYLDELVVKTIPQEQQRFNALRSGDVDIDSTSTPATIKQGLDANMSEVHRTNLTASGMRFSAKNGDVVDRDVRTVIAHALDLDAIREAVASDTPIPRTIALEGGALYDETATLPGYDPAKAQELLDAYLARTGKPGVSLKYMTVGGTSQTVQENQLIKAQLEKIKGMTVEIEEVDVVPWSTRLRQGQYEATLHTLGASLDPSTLYGRLHSKGAENSAGYSNPTVDRALDAARSTNDPAQRTPHLKDALKAYSQDVAMIPWTMTVQYWFHTGKIGGLTPAYIFYPRPDLLWKG